MAPDPVAADPSRTSDRVPPYSEESERGVLGSILLDANRVMDLCIASQLDPDAFYVPLHRTIYSVLLDMNSQGSVIDVLTTTERLDARGKLKEIGGSTSLERLIDATPTAAHAEYYIDIVRQKHLLRRIIACSGALSAECFRTEDTADQVLSRAEQSILEIGEGQHGTAVPWKDAVKESMEQIERIIQTRRGLTGVSTGFAGLDKILQGLRAGEMIVLAARPSMGKTSLAMNIAENIALGIGDPDKTSRAVGIFSLEMSYQALVMRMLCSHARVSGFRLSSGYVDSKGDHAKLATAASVLMKAPIYLDDTGGLDIMELRARARRMRKRFNIEMIMVDYLQLLNSREHARQGRQLETAQISGNLKAMAKELNVPVLVLSQLSRAPDQRDKLGKPKLSDLRDSGAIEQDADVVCMLRRPCQYGDDVESGDERLAVVDVAKHRNGPTGEVRLNFEDAFIRFENRKEQAGVDQAEVLEPYDEMAERLSE